MHNFLSHFVHLHLLISPLLLYPSQSTPQYSYSVLVYLIKYLKQVYTGVALSLIREWEREYGHIRYWRMTDNSNFVGKQIGSYRIVNQLSTRGGFGSVYLGKHIVFTNRPIVAIKVLPTHLASEQEKERFLQEARFLDQLKHPHILPIIEAGTEDGLPFLIAEYASGGSLKDRLQKQGPYPLSL
jgi:serine/threonine protein kinase